MYICNKILEKQDQPYPRTCQVCGLGPCIKMMMVLKTEYEDLKKAAGIAPHSSREVPRLLTVEDHHVINIERITRFHWYNQRLIVHFDDGNSTASDDVNAIKYDILVRAMGGIYK